MSETRKTILTYMMVQLLSPDGFMQSFMSAISNFLVCSIIFKL